MSLLLLHDLCLPLREGVMDGKAWFAFAAAARAAEDAAQLEAALSLLPNGCSPLQLAASSPLLGSHGDLEALCARGLGQQLLELALARSDNPSQALGVLVEGLSKAGPFQHCPALVRCVAALVARQQEAGLLDGAAGARLLLLGVRAGCLDLAAVEASGAATRGWCRSQPT